MAVAMTKPKLTYFDFPGGRGEECRLALYLAGVDFEDHRIKGPTWMELKPDTPFGGLPVLEIEGKGKLAQSNVILTFIGQNHGLLPSDPWDAAQHAAIMGACEDLRVKLQYTAVGASEEEKKAARDELASGYLKEWGGRMENRIEGPFVGGSTPSVADIKLFVIQKWFVGGGLDHIPTDVFADFPKLMVVYAAVKAHPKVVEWYAR